LVKIISTICQAITILLTILYANGGGLADVSKKSWVFQDYIGPDINLSPIVKEKIPTFLEIY
jgi:hypothetical protein